MPRDKLPRDQSTLWINTKMGAKYGLRLIHWVWLLIWTSYQISLGVILVLLVLGIYGTGKFFKVWEIRELRNTNPTTTAFMEAEKLRLVHAAATNPKASDKIPEIKQTWIAMSKIPRLIQDLVLVAEDAKFYQHKGFDFEQIEYAIVANHQAGKKARGASTISQQVVKNLFLSNKKSMDRKIHEAAVTLLMEHFLGKKRILEIYLNMAQFGPGVFGVYEGAMYHFHKKPQELNQDESLALVALLPSPIKWSPKSLRGPYLSHKSRITRNYGLYKGIRLGIAEKADSDSSNFDEESSAFDSLAESLSEERWKGLRSGPLESEEEDESSESNSSKDRDSIDSSFHSDEKQSNTPTEDILEKMY